MKLKVCGMKYPDNIKQVTTLQPDYLGLIFYDKSARFFNANIPEVPNTIKKVGVFVDADLEDVFKIIKKHDLQAVQLHGNESPNYCTELKSKLDLIKQQWKDNVWKPNTHRQRIEYLEDIEIIKVFSIKDEFNFEALKPYETVCDYYLFDTKGKLPGGNGYTFNWDVLNQYPSTKPFFLSGGIGIDQINDIKSFQQSKASYYCFALDVNSKFEIKPGLKDIKLLKEFKQHLSC
ncbi:phosphoribosylanthranilate isomerase [Aestuariivivens sp. NBU2969]|uniref:phosphoribosylanthranilate isomerase n=1 Tax=Aestuariivivens sp. NBU2969 TaxID=2873267 RepID=UPI001CBC3A2C|nr:phosphoribosylanthranilate isomerase [Aestuariivivens sp. NBU2969]